MSSSNQRPANRGFRSVLRCAISHYRQSPSLSAPEPWGTVAASGERKTFAPDKTRPNESRCDESSWASGLSRRCEASKTSRRWNGPCCPASSFRVTNSRPAQGSLSKASGPSLRRLRYPKASTTPPSPHCTPSTPPIPSYAGGLMSSSFCIGPADSGGGDSLYSPSTTHAEISSSAVPGCNDKCRPPSPSKSCSRQVKIMTWTFRDAILTPIHHIGHQNCLP